MLKQAKKIIPNNNKNQKKMEKDLNEQNNNSGEDEQFPGYPASAPGEDIYQREEHVSLKVNPESALDGLDVPGSELDDANEAIGEEDEENNSYSLGGDRHQDLEEHQE